VKNRNLIIGIIVATVVLVIFLAMQGKPAKKAVKKAVPAAGKAQPGLPAKKAISKDKGALTVKATDSKGKEVNVRIKAFRSYDARSSLYDTSFAANRMQELSPGNYDLEIETTPAKIYKGVNIAKGKEHVEDLGAITGAVLVKATDSRGKAAAYPVRAVYSRTTLMVASGTMNRPLELVPGAYDIEIWTAPRQLRRDVKVEAGKENLIDLGCATGSLIVKTADESGKAVKSNVRVTRPENGEAVLSGKDGQPMELLPGIYDVETMAGPRHVKKGNTVKAGEETVVELIIQAPKPAPAAAPAKPKK